MPLSLNDVFIFLFISFRCCNSWDADSRDEFPKTSMELLEPLVDVPFAEKGSCCLHLCLRDCNDLLPLFFEPFCFFFFLRLSLILVLTLTLMWCWCWSCWWWWWWWWRWCLVACCWFLVVALWVLVIVFVLWLCVVVALGQLHCFLIQNFQQNIEFVSHSVAATPKRKKRKDQQKNDELLVYRSGGY